MRMPLAFLVALLCAAVAGGVDKDQTLTPEVEDLAELASLFGPPDCNTANARLAGRHRYVRSVREIYACVDDDGDSVFEWTRRPGKILQVTSAELLARPCTEFVNTSEQVAEVDAGAILGIHICTDLGVDFAWELAATAGGGADFTDRLGVCYMDPDGDLRTSAINALMLVCTVVVLPPATYGPCDAQISFAFDGQTLRGEGGAIIDCSAGQPLGAIVFNDKSDTTLANISFIGDPGGAGGDVVRSSPPGTGSTFRYLAIDGSSGNGLFIDSDAAEVTLNETTGTFDLSAFRSTADGVVLDRNTIEGSVSLTLTSGLRATLNVFLGTVGAGNSFGYVFENNKFAQQVSFSQSGDGLWSNNDFAVQSGAKGLFLQGGGPYRVAGNSFIGVPGSVYGIEISGVDTITVNNNHFEGVHSIIEATSSNIIIGPGNTYLSSGRPIIDEADSFDMIVVGPKLGIGTPFPRARVHIDAPTVAHLLLDGAGGCLEMLDTDLIGFTCLTSLNGVLTISDCMVTPCG